MTNDTLGLRRPAHVLAVCSGADNDPGLLATAAAFAARNDAALTVLSVVEPPLDIDALAVAAEIDTQSAIDRLLTDRRDRVAAPCASFDGIAESSIVIRSGKPFLEIIRYVIEADVDFVVKAAEPLHGLQSFLFASTDQHLLRKCPCPVWLRQPDAPEAITRVMAAVDVDLTDAEEPDTLGALNARVMTTAAHLSAVSDTPIAVLHAWDAPGEGLVRRWSDRDDANIAAERYVAAIHSGRARAMEGLTAGVMQSMDAMGEPTPRYQTVLSRGPVRTVIASQVEKLHADILVIGTVARTGLHGVIIGNTAEDILNSVRCSVVAVKPPGFVTPLDFGA